MSSFTTGKYFTLIVLLLSSCGGSFSTEVPGLVPSETNILSTSTMINSPIPSSTATSTSTPDPNLPCGGIIAERVYLFMDCTDIRRVRAAVRSANSEFMKEWKNSKQIVDTYRSKFPTTYDPDASWNTLWWGSGNFITRDMALIYLVTGDEDYARDILRLLELVKNNTPQVAALTNFDSPNGRGEENSGGILSHPQYGGVVIQSTLFAYLAIRETSLFNNDQRDEYDRFFQHQAELLEQAAIFRGNQTPLDGKINRNVPLAANLAALTIARSFPDSVAMQELDARVWPALEWELGNWWQLDGGWGEDTQNYGFSRLESILLLAETSLRMESKDIYSMDFNGRSINSMCRFFLESVTPEGTVPALNDTDHYPVDPGLFRLCGYRTNNPDLYFAESMYKTGRVDGYGVNATSFMTAFHLLAWVNLGGETTQVPEFTSILLPYTGAAILRDGWERTSQYALLQFTGSRVHEEYSFGALYLFANGPWLVGNGYNIPGARPTSKHSTLGMDNSDQTFTGGDAIAFADLGWTGIAGVTSRSYINLQHTRLLLWIKPWSQWIVVDDAVSDTPDHLLQQRWYVRGIIKPAKDNVWPFGGNKPGDELTIQFMPALDATYNRISRKYSWEEWVSDAPGVEMDVPYQDQPVRLVTSLAVTTNWSQAPVITRLDESGLTRIVSTLGDSSWTWFLPAIGSKTGKEVNLAITGVAGCVEKRSEKLGGYCLMNGTELNYQGQDLVRSEQDIYFESDPKGGKVYLSVSKTTNISFFWSGKVTKVSFGGRDLEFKQDQNLITIQLDAGQYTLDIQ